MIFLDVRDIEISLSLGGAVHCTQLTKRGTMYLYYMYNKNVLAVICAQWSGC